MTKRKQVRETEDEVDSKNRKKILKKDIEKLKKADHLLTKEKELLKNTTDTRRTFLIFLVFRQFYKLNCKTDELQEDLRLSPQFLQFHFLERLKLSYEDALYCAQFLQFTALMSCNSIWDYFQQIGIFTTTRRLI